MADDCEISHRLSVFLPQMIDVDGKDASGHAWAWRPYLEHEFAAYFD